MNPHAVIINDVQKQVIKICLTYLEKLIEQDQIDQIDIEEIRNDEALADSLQHESVEGLIPIGSNSNIETASTLLKDILNNMFNNNIIWSIGL